MGLVLALVAAISLLDGLAALRGLILPRPVDVFYAVVMAILSYLWLRQDARERRQQVGALMSGLVIACAVIGIPVYLMRSRPAGERLRAVGRFFGFVVVAAGLSLLVSIPFYLAAPA